MKNTKKEMTMNNVPRVGVGVCILRDNKVLLGKRKNSHGEGTWCFPGGHLEFMEEWNACAIRETLEETGLKITDMCLGAVTNDFFPQENKHYVTMIIVADYIEGEAKLLEPHKCERWEWFEWDKNKLPSPLFISQQNLLKQDFDPFKQKWRTNNS